MNADIFVAILGGVFFLTLGLFLFFGSRSAEAVGKAQAEAILNMDTMERMLNNTDAREGQIAALAYASTHGFIDKKEAVAVLTRPGVTVSGRPQTRS